MANFTILGTVDGSRPVEEEFDVVAGTASSIVSGDLATMANGYAVLAPNGGLSAAGFHGIAVSTSTETAAAAGKVRIKYATTGLKVRGVPTTPGNLATAILFDRVTVDLSGTTQTIDENDAGNGVATIMAYDATTDQETIDVVVTATL